MTALIKYEAARKALQEAKRVDEVKKIRDQAEAMRAYARQANDMDLMNWAAEIKLRAERKAGEMLADMEKNKGGRPSKKNQSHDVTSLADIGVSRKQSSRWQQIAKVPEEKFEQHIERQRESGAELTSSGVRKLASKKPAADASRKPESVRFERSVSKAHSMPLTFLREVGECVKGDPRAFAAEIIREYPFEKKFHEKSFAELGPALQFANELYKHWSKHYG